MTIIDKPTEAASFETPAEAPEYQPSDSRFASRFKLGPRNHLYRTRLTWERQSAR